MIINQVGGGTGGEAASGQTIVEPVISSVIPFPPICLTSALVRGSGLDPKGRSPTSYGTITEGVYAYCPYTSRGEGCGSYGAYGTRDFGLGVKNEAQDWSIDEAWDFKFTGISFDPSEVTSMFAPSDTPYEMDMVAYGIFDLPAKYSGRIYHNYLRISSEIVLKLNISKDGSGNDLVELVRPISVHVDPYTCTWGGTNLPLATPVLYLTMLRTP